LEKNWSSADGTTPNDYEEVSWTPTGKYNKNVVLLGQTKIKYFFLLLKHELSLSIFNFKNLAQYSVG